MLFAAAAVAVLAVSSASPGGDLDPPAGAVEATMKTLEEVNVPDNAADNIEVRNGTSEGWGNDGIDLRFAGDQRVVRDVRVIDCAGTGLRGGSWAHQPQLPGTPLKGPARSGVIHPL
jgi:hypothetical protein